MFSRFQVFLASTILIVLLLGGGAFAFVKARKSNYPTVKDLQDRIRVTLVVRDELPGMEEARLVPDRRSVVLGVDIESDRIGEELEMWPEFEDVEWTTSFGQLEALTPNHHTVEFTPGSGSSTAYITVVFRGRYGRGLDSRLFGPRDVEAKASIALVVPASSSDLKDGWIDGYNLGEYIDPKDKTAMAKWGVTSGWPVMFPDRYAPPDFFYKIDKDNFDLPISRSFKLGDYALHYSWYSQGMPQYVALDYNLLRKMEELIDLMNGDGYKIERFTIVYPFRSPYYNLSSIEEDGQTTLKAPFSMHQYGKALDIIIDQDGDLVIDDLNGDGKIDMHDPAVIMKYVNQLDRRYREQGDPRVGGAGLYSRTDFHQRKQTPYLHFDVRGFTNPNGNLIRWPSQWPDGSAIRWGDI